MLVALALLVLVGYLAIEAKKNREDRRMEELIRSGKIQFQAEAQNSLLHPVRRGSDEFPKRGRKLQEHAVSVAEAHRRENWKANFPWPPATDPRVRYDPVKYALGYRPTHAFEAAMLGRAESNHERLKRFYADDIRFSSQFEQTCNILSEYGMTNNQVLTSWIFGHMWNYHQRKETNPQRALRSRNSIVANLLRSGWNRPPYISSAKREERKEVYRMVARRLVDEVKGMETLPVPWPMTDEENRMQMSYGQMFQHGDPELVGDMLVPYAGWVDDFAATFKQRRSGIPTSLLNDDQPELTEQEVYRILSDSLLEGFPDRSKVTVVYTVEDADGNSFVTSREEMERILKGSDQSPPIGEEN